MYRKSIKKKKNKVKLNLMCGNMGVNFLNVVSVTNT